MFGIPVSNVVDGDVVINNVQNTRADNLVDFDVSNVVDQVAQSVVDANDSYNFLNTVASHLGSYSAQTMNQIQNQIEEFSLSTQLISKTVSTTVKDVDSLIRMQ